MLHSIEIAILLYQLLRTNYAITNAWEDSDGVEHAPTLSNIYVFLLCCLYSLNSTLQEWETMRRKEYAVAGAEGYGSQVINILNRYYGGYGNIYLGGSTTTSYYLYPSSSTAQYFNPEGDTPTYLYPASSGGIGTTIVNIPLALQNSADYDDFIADLNAMTLYGLTVTIETYG